MKHKKLEKVMMLALASILFCTTLTFNILSVVSGAYKDSYSYVPPYYYLGMLALNLAMLAGACVMGVIIVRRYLGDPATDSLALEEEDADFISPLPPLMDYDTMTPEERHLFEAQLEARYHSHEFPT